MPGDLSTDGLVAVGDTVPTIDPLWGEGIHKCMKSGRAAAVAADHCLTPADPDTSAESLSVYDSLWHDEVAPDMRTRLRLTQLLYLAPNERYDTLMADLRSADSDALAAANGGSPLAVARLLHLRDVPLLAKFLRDRIR
jgi:digeranylgeranylglycerophospholipid reductase